MALPKLNDNPSYRVTVPSTGQETSFRPFLVKEQKALLIAYETQDKKDMIRAVLKTIEACIEEPLRGNLTTFDVDYLFTKIRAKSVGETADIQVKCSKCESINEVSAEQFERVTEFVSNMPTVTQEIAFKCVSCKHKNVRTLKGMDDFF